MACDLRELINIEDPKNQYNEVLDMIVKLQEDVNSSLRRLFAFKEMWDKQEAIIIRVDEWIVVAEKRFNEIHNSSKRSTSQFWVSCSSF
jgi:hypothetical protein